jgi:hypothetical protein
MKRKEEEEEEEEVLRTPETKKFFSQIAHVGMFEGCSMMSLRQWM